MERKDERPQAQPLVLQTGVSKAFWCMLQGNENAVATFEPAEIAMDDEEPGPISWLDRLLKGGIRLPSEKGKPLVFLMKGPPGSGKTTLTLELCYRLAIQQNLSSLYVSIDAETDRLIENAKSLGWKDIDHRILPAKGRGTTALGRVEVWGRDKIERQTPSETVANAYRVLQAWLLGGEEHPSIDKFGDPIKPSQTVIGGTHTNKRDTNIPPDERASPDILVIDSLNVVEGESRGKFFDRFLEIAGKQTKLLILTLDSRSDTGHRKFWEYIADIIIDLDYTYQQNYYIRTIEVVKARYQTHIWGRHQLKIYSALRRTQAPQPRQSDHEAALLKYNTRMRRAHPYREEGGVFIYPSIHYYLSTYKRRSAIHGFETTTTCPKELDNIVGFPKGRCTAFIGHRGGHKSHLGYLHILNRLTAQEKEGALIVSLREDEGVTKSTMNRILETDRQFSDMNSKPTIDALEKENRLEVLYYPPGYITPEEFFHRMLMSIHRLKKNCHEITLLFNSLDQLSARFPLCAKQEIFIPGIVEMLVGESISSIFIAVEEQGQPVEQYGLLPMADLILSFERRRFSFNDYYNHLNEARGLDETQDEFGERIQRIKTQFYISLDDKERHPQAHREEIVLQVVRFAGGQKAGASGILELVKGTDDELHDKPGLYFTELSPKYSPGLLIDAHLTLASQAADAKW